MSKLMFRLAATLLPAMSLIPFLPNLALAGPVAVRGIVTKIDGEMVTLKQPWGDEITVKVDERIQNRIGWNALVVGADTAIVLDPNTNNPSVAIKVSTCVSPAPPFVAVQPIAVPPLGAPPVFTPAPRPVAPPPPEAPPPRILY
uniref:Uncharacterized protein n=1 Tax=Cyanothece sp. (strain PCC 7425 / ATCC 29141) TaxID=395961 RepID=B8HNV9_CYAP4